MAFRIHARAFFVAMGALAISVASTVPTFAQSFAPVVVVNDQIITGFDVQQRALLNSVTQGGERNLQAALDELIADTLRLQAASRFGIDPTPGEVRAGFDEISRLNRRDPNQMRSGLLSRGISSEALDAQIKAEVAWRRLIVQRFGPRAEITDNEVDEAIGPEADVAEGETQYLLSEIRFPIEAGGEATARAAATAAVDRMASGTRFSVVAREVSKGPTALTGGDLGWVSRSTLSPASSSAVSVLNVDRVTPPFVDGGDVVIYGLRATREAGDAGAASYTLAQLVVGLPAGAPQAEADAALARAAAVRGELKTCEDVAARASQYLPISGDLGKLSLAAMPGPVREAVSGLDVGDITQPVRSNDGFHVIVVCDKESTAPPAERRRAQVGGQLRAQRLERYSRSFLRELRREAVIERR